MKFIVALLATALLAPSEASHLPSSPWSLTSGWGAWNGWSGFPYGNTWSTTAWPAAYSPYGAVYGGHPIIYSDATGHKTVVQANIPAVHKPYLPAAWGPVPWGVGGVYAAGGWSHHSAHRYGQQVVAPAPVVKQIAATPGSLHVAPVPVGGIGAVVV